MNELSEKQEYIIRNLLLNIRSSKMFNRERSELEAQLDILEQYFDCEFILGHDKHKIIIKRS